MDESLALMERVAGILQRGGGSEVMLGAILAEACGLLDAERGFVLLLSEAAPEATEPSLETLVSHNLDPSDLAGQVFAFSRGIVRDVVESGQGKAIIDAGLDERYGQRKSVLKGEMRSVVCAPLVCDGRTLGAIYLDNRGQRGVFGPDELKTLEAFSSVAAMAVRLAGLQREREQLTSERASSRQRKEDWARASRAKSELLGQVTFALRQPLELLNELKPYLVSSPSLGESAQQALSDALQRLQQVHKELEDALTRGFDGEVIQL